MSNAIGEKSNDHFTLSVKVPSGEVISIEASPEMLVSELKQRIVQMTKYPSAMQILHLGKQRLSNKVRLFTYNLSEKSGLVLSVLWLDPDMIVRQLRSGTFDLEVVCLSSSTGYPKDIFTDLTDIDKFSANCVVCMDIPRNAMELNCDECLGVICENCLKKATEQAAPGEVGKIKCLTDKCESLIDLNESIKNRAIRKLIRQQKVKCSSTMTFNDKQCEWIGTTEELDDHIALCKFQRVNCPFKCDTVICKGFATLEGHFTKCPEFLLNCRHCLEFYSRQEIIDHEAKCPEELLCCNFNCGKEFVKRDMKKHNHESLIIHVQCLQKELDNERKKRLVIEGEMKCLKKELDSVKYLKKELDLERQKRLAIEDEIKEQRKILEGKGVAEFLGSLQREAMLRDLTGPFDLKNTTAGWVISENGKRVTGSGMGTAGCSNVLSQGKIIFKVKFIQYQTEYCVGFFPTGLGKPKAVFIGYSFPGHGYTGTRPYGKYIRSGFKGHHGRNVGDIITAILDFDKGTISYMHNGEDLGVAFENIKGTYYAGVSWEEGGQNSVYIL